MIWVKNETCKHATQLEKNSKATFERINYHPLVDLKIFHYSNPTTGHVFSLVSFAGPHSHTDTKLTGQNLLYLNTGAQIVLS